MDLKFEISLQSLSFIATAESIWNREDIASELKQHLCGKMENWDVLSKKAMSCINPESLPFTLYSQLIHIIDSIGKKRRAWFKHLKKKDIFKDVQKHDLYEYYFKEIHWTHYGTIDEEKIIKSWFGNPNCDRWKIYVTACCFCSENTIKEIWTVVHEKYGPECFKKLYNKSEWHIAAYWDRRFSETLENIIADFKLNLKDEDAKHFYHEDDSLAWNMFCLSVAKGYKLPAKMFWFELTKKEKKSMIKLNYLRAILSFPVIEFETSIYRQEVFIELIVFLIGFVNDNALNEDDFNNVLNYLTDWPWIELLVPFLHYTLQHFSQNLYKSLFGHLTRKLAKDFIVENSIFERKLLQLWRIIPSNYKELVADSIIEELLKAQDVSDLKLTLSNSSLMQNRESSQTELFSLKILLKKKVNGKNVKIMIKKICPPNALEKPGKLNLKINYRYLLNGVIDKVDEYNVHVRHKYAKKKIY